MAKDYIKINVTRKSPDDQVDIVFDSIGFTEFELIGFLEKLKCDVLENMKKGDFNVITEKPN